MKGNQMIQCRNMTRPQTGKGVIDWERCESLTDKTYTTQQGRGDAVVSGVPVCKDCATKIRGTNPQYFKEDK